MIENGWMFSMDSISCNQRTLILKRSLIHCEYKTDPFPLQFRQFLFDNINIFITSQQIHQSITSFIAITFRDIAGFYVERQRFVRMLVGLVHFAYLSLGSAGGTAALSLQ